MNEKWPFQKKVNQFKSWGKKYFYVRNTECLIRINRTYNVKIIMLYKSSSYSSSRFITSPQYSNGHFHYQLNCDTTKLMIYSMSEEHHQKNKPEKVQYLTRNHRFSGLDTSIFSYKNQKVN